MCCVYEYGSTRVVCVITVVEWVCVSAVVECVVCMSTVVECVVCMSSVVECVLSVSTVVE